MNTASWYIKTDEGSENKDPLSIKLATLVSEQEKGFLKVLRGPKDCCCALKDGELVSPEEVSKDRIIDFDEFACGGYIEIEGIVEHYAYMLEKVFDTVGREGNTLIWRVFPEIGEFNPNKQCVYSRFAIAGRDGTKINAKQMTPANPCWFDGKRIHFVNDVLTNLVRFDKETQARKA
ncbi:MAG: hypothetical protein PHY29_02715 [Syntrophales bacterium]|nr:hypothetical protein [Syntrophales bacterium]